MLSIPNNDVRGALAQEAIPVSGSLNYTPEIFAKVSVGDSVFFDASEDEVWVGDFNGTAVAPFRMVVTPDGVWDAWLYAEFEGTVLGEYEGTMSIVSRYKRLAPNAHWAGEWIILSGTGELEDVQGHGTAWGPGFDPKETESTRQRAMSILPGGQGWSGPGAGLSFEATGPAGL